MTTPHLERFEITEPDGSTSTLVALTCATVEDIEYALLVDEGAMADAADDFAIYIYAVVPGPTGRELQDIDDAVETKIFAWFEENVGLTPSDLLP